MSLYFGSQCCSRQTGWVPESCWQEVSTPTLWEFPCYELTSLVVRLDVNLSGRGLFADLGCPHLAGTTVKILKSEHSLFNFSDTLFQLLEFVCAHTHTYTHTHTHRSRKILCRTVDGESVQAFGDSHDVTSLLWSLKARSVNDRPKAAGCFAVAAP